MHRAPAPDRRDEKEIRFAVLAALALRFLARATSTGCRRSARTADGLNLPGIRRSCNYSRKPASCRLSWPASENAPSTAPPRADGQETSGPPGSRRRPRSPHPPGLVSRVWIWLRGGVGRDLIGGPAETSRNSPCAR